jgi:hypothetical protein
MDLIRGKKTQRTREKMRGKGIPCNIAPSNDLRDIQMGPRGKSNVERSEKFQRNLCFLTSDMKVFTPRGF